MLLIYEEEIAAVRKMRKKWMLMLPSRLMKSLMH